MTANAPQSSATVQRQIVLPLSKAVEIAYKSIRLRLSRSLLVTSGIVLALAFLMSILANGAMITSMRNWASAFQSSTEFKQLQATRDRLHDEKLIPLDAELHKAAQRPGQPPAGAVTFDPIKEFGEDFPALQKDLGMPLPASAGDLTTLLTAQPNLQSHMKEWVDTARQMKTVREKIIGPDSLREMMKNNGVPSTPAEIENNRIQTRWLLSLALLVAFVGILNAMLMSVTERFREIGTMKCLGALDSFIIKLFLIESLFQGVVGTVIGVLLGLAMSLVSVATSYGSFAWKNMPVSSLVTSFVICLVVGIGLTVAGAVYPAWQAARMQPIDAMRVEA